MPMLLGQMLILCKQVVFKWFMSFYKFSDPPIVKSWMKFRSKRKVPRRIFLKGSSMLYRYLSLLVSLSSSKGKQDTSVSNNANYLRDTMNIAVAYLERSTNYSASDTFPREYRKITFLLVLYVTDFTSSLWRKSNTQTEYATIDRLATLCSAIEFLRNS